jgi:two-component SAPR family response regulator/predicted negative regulator of RcsB-dependent stress response
VLTRRALAYRQMGDYLASLKDAEEALKLTEPDITLQPLYAEALRIKGANLYRLGHSRQAIDYLEHSLSLFTALKETGSIPILLVETGAVYSAIGDIEAAKTSFQKALLIWQTEKNITAQADVLNNLAVLYHQNGEYEAAVEMFENGLSLARKSRYTRAEALILIGLGDLYAEVGEFESADQAYEKALPISKQWAGSFIEIYLILARANLATLQNDAVRGKAILQGARKKLQSTSSLYEQGLQALIEGRIFMLDSKAAKAVTAFTLCKEKFTQDGRIIESLWSCVWLTAALSESGKVELARAELRELLNLYGRPTHATLVALQQAATWLRPMLKDPQAGRSLGGLMEKADRLEAKLPGVRRSLRRLAQSIQMPAASLSIRAFGRAEVQVDGHAVSSSEWSAQSVRDLFFYLIYKGGAVTKEQIAASLWPEVYDLQILKQRFKTYLFRLRRATRRDVVIFDDEYYRFNYALDYEYDVETFETYLARSRTARGVDERIEHIQKAVDLIQGPYLAEVDMPWALGERERLEQAYLVALENLAQLYLDTDQFQQSVMTLQRALKSDPYIERVHQLLMRAHAALGDRSAIHRQYQVCKTSLLELGFSPSHETETLYRSLTR